MDDAPLADVRTFATWLRDHMPITAEVAARLASLDHGRHATLTEMRFALGLDVELDACEETARSAVASLDPLPADADLAALLDSMYRAIGSTRLVRVECGAAGPVPSRDHAPLVLRGEQRLVLLVLADNTTDAQVQFSAEAHGEGIGGYIEPGRTGSALFDAGTMHEGSYLLPLMVVADGRPATIDLPIECVASGELTVHIIDDETGEPVAARVYLADDVGAAWPAGVPIRADEHGDPWFHADGSFGARVCGQVLLRVARGIEYEEELLSVRVPPDGEQAVTVRLRRWSHMAADGWFSGDVHVHMHYGGEYVLTPEDAALAQRAEDVHFLNMAVANVNSGHVLDEDRFEGRDHALTTPTHILRWGEEYRNDFYGHMCLYGIGELVPPVYSGFIASAHPHDAPANAAVARHCHAIGGTLSYAHPVMRARDLGKMFAVARAFEAKELPVDAALGLVDAIDVMSYPADHMATASLWYRLLNCGLDLAATAGSDTFMNHADHGAFSNPPAGVRAFVRVDGGLTTESWCAGVRAGRTFVTNGPMLRIEVAGREPGDRIAAQAGDVLHIEAEAGAAAAMHRLELIIDGDVAAEVVADGGAQRIALEHDLTVRGRCWIALRARGPAGSPVLGGEMFAHTSAVYVDVDGAPRASATDAAYFVEWIDRLIDLATREGRYRSDDERGGVFATFREGRAFFERIAGPSESK